MVISVSEVGVVHQCPFAFISLYNPSVHMADYNVNAGICQQNSHHIHSTFVHCWEKLLVDTNVTLIPAGGGGFLV